MSGKEKKRRDRGRKLVSLWVEGETARGLKRWAAAAGMSEVAFVRGILDGEVARLDEEEEIAKLCEGEGLM